MINAMSKVWHILCIIKNCNIHNGQGFGIFQAIWAVQVGGFDLMVLMETKITG